MTDDIPEGVKAQAERTRRAQKTFEHFASNMEGMVNRVKPEAVSIEELPKDYRKTCSEYLDALRRANEEEAKLATECENFRGVNVATQRFDLGIGGFLNSSFVGLDTKARTYFADTPLIIESQDADFIDGVIRLCIHKVTFQPPAAV